MDGLENTVHEIDKLSLVEVTVVVGVVLVEVLVDGTIEEHSLNVERHSYVVYIYFSMEYLKMWVLNRTLDYGK
jgi:hypothetical protein